MGEVLEHKDRSLTQSGVILHYLATQHGRFGAQNAEDAQETLRWILFYNHKFASYYAVYRWLHHFTPDADLAVKVFFKARAESAFVVTERHLADRHFILGDRPTIADLSMAGYHFYPPEETGFDLPASHPNIAAWLGRIRALPGWRPAYELLPGQGWPRGWRRFRLP
jgi:glutathione S-transferase